MRTICIIFLIFAFTSLKAKDKNSFNFQANPIDSTCDLVYPGSGLDTTVVIIDKRGVLYNQASGVTSGNNMITYNLSATPTNFYFDPNNMVLANASSISVNTLLPVKNIFFITQKKENRVFIDFRIAMGSTPKNIMLERSEDGLNFISISDFPLHANTANVFLGSYIDDIISNSQYYRLKIINSDEVAEYSNVEQITGNNIHEFRVYPNPGSSYLPVSVSPLLMTKRLKLMIQNTNGQIVKEVNCNSTDNLDIKKMPGGIYNIKIINDRNEFLNAKFIKQ